MSLKIFVLKYVAQLKALNPKYDQVFELQSENNPVIYQDRDNLRLSFATIADTHLPNRESATLNLNNLILDAEKSKAADAFDESYAKENSIPFVAECSASGM